MDSGVEQTRTPGKMKGDTRRHGGKEEVGKLGWGCGELAPFSAGVRGRQHLVQIFCPTETWQVVPVVENQLCGQG